jgi:catechol 2,3-dioxygenase-like lactoylglutathione lyase family enzyme
MIHRVGHVGIRVADLERSVKHAETIMGLREVERVNGASYLTCNERHHELVLVEDAGVACDHLAFEVAGAEELDELRRRALNEGLHVLSEEPEEPGIEGAIRFVGPGGFVFEVFHGMALDQPRDYNTVGARPRKFEHITLKASDKEGMEDFLVRVFGFRLSDRSGDSISWLRCSPEHHGVSVIRAEKNQLQHYAWQVADYSDTRIIGDQLMRNGKTFLWGPGHHGIGDNYFCYFYDDDGVIVEYSADIMTVENEEAYRPRTWPDEPLSVNRWGNPPPPEEFVNGGTDLYLLERAEANRG